MKKENYWETEANRRNTPHLYLNILMISMFYGFTGLNMLLLSLLSEIFSKRGICLGIIFVCLIPITIYDRRKEMCGIGRVIMVGIIHLVSCLSISYFLSVWCGIGVYIGEALLCFVSCFICRRRKHW